jgi:cation transport ATPase
MLLARERGRGADVVAVCGAACKTRALEARPSSADALDTSAGAHRSAAGIASPAASAREDRRAGTQAFEVAALPLVELGGVAAAALFALLASTFTAAAWLSAGASVFVAGRSLLLSRGATPATMRAGLVAAAGVTLCAIGNLPVGAGATATVVGALGTALAAAAVLHRAWRDSRSNRAVLHLVHQVEQATPEMHSIARAGSTFDGMSPLSAASDEPLRRGESILVSEGEVLTADGVVRSGQAIVTTHAFDPTPVSRVTGDPVLAGSRVLEGELRIQVTGVGSGRALAQALLPSDETQLTGALLLGEVFAKYAPYGVWVVAVAGAALAHGSGFGAMLSVFGAVLFAAPFLAVERSTRDALRASTAAAARRGVFFGDAGTVESAGRVGSVVIAPRGTLTRGMLEVAAVKAVTDDGEEELLAWALGVESLIPKDAFSRALLEYGDKQGVRARPVRRAALVPGRGVTASTPEGEPVIAGTRQLLLENGVSVALADAEAKIAETRGHSVMFVGVAGRVRGLVAFRDSVQSGSRAAVQRFIDIDADVVLVSGDHRGTLETLAKHLAIENVRAELAPEDRTAEVTRMKEAGRVVAAIGRVGEDDEILAAADVSVLIDAAGLVEGQRPGAIAIAGGDVRDAAIALWMARAMRKTTFESALAAIGGGSAITFLAGANLVPLVVAAALVIVLDAYAIPTAERLLDRFDRRVPEAS